MSAPGEGWAIPPIFTPAIGPGETRDDDSLRLRLAVEATGIGVYDYDLVTRALRWDARTRAMFDVAPDAPITFEGSFVKALHPEDRDRVCAALTEAADPAGAGLFDEEYRVLGPDGATVRWVAARGRLVVADGRAARIVGAVRETTRQKSDEAAIKATEERYRLVGRATNDAIWDWDLVADSVLWNEALETTYGWAGAAVEPTGAWWLSKVHPSDRAVVSADIHAVIDGRGADWSHEYRFQRADGSYADVLDRGYMVRGENGAPVRMIGAMLDITARNRAEAQFRAVFEGANIGIVQFDPRNARALRVNAKLCEIWGASAHEIVGHSVARWTPPEDEATRDALHKRIATGEAMQERFEKRYRRADGRIIWARVNLVSQTLGDSVHATAMIEDITEEKRADARREALIALSDRLRDLCDAGAVVAAAVEILGGTLGAARAGYATAEPAAGTLTIGRDSSDAGAHAPVEAREAIARLSRGEALAVAAGSDAAALPWLAEPAQLAVPLLERGRLVGALYACHALPHSWSAGEIAFAREVAERAWGGLARIEADERQRMLNRELSHRLKNTLAMVQAIASQTLRNVTDVEAAKEALVARLIALGAAHDILLTGERESAGIEAVIAGALALHDDRQPGRFRLAGPPITIGSQAALSLSLMMHELATNAAKYGALAAPEGRVAVDWSVDAGAPEPTVRLLWAERGGPAVAPPSRKGFGTRLIERGLAGAVGGVVRLDYAPDGLVCHLEAPLAGFQAED